MKVRRVVELLRDGEQGRARLREEAAAAIVERLPLELRRAAVVDAAIRATQPHVVGSRGYAGPDGLGYKELYDHAATPLAAELSPEELAAAQHRADMTALNDRLEAGGADVWAAEFAEMFRLDLGPEVQKVACLSDDGRETFILDRGTLIGWFANAMEHGRQRGRTEGWGSHGAHLHFAVPSGAFSANGQAADVPLRSVGGFAAMLRERLGGAS